MRGLIPMWLFGFLAWTGRRGTERSLNCRFPGVESAVARLAPRPWLMIHGQRDTYIGPEIAQDLFDHGKDPKELWLVPNAKHNRCRETPRMPTRRSSWAFWNDTPHGGRSLAPTRSRFQAHAGCRATSLIRWSPRRLVERSGGTHPRLTQRVGATAGHDQDAHADDRCARRQASARGWRRRFSTRHEPPATFSASCC